MRTTERLRKLQAFFQKELCDGRLLKMPPKDQSILDVQTTEPKVFLAWQPLNPNTPGRFENGDAYTVCPSITIMPAGGYLRNNPEQRFDRYSGFHRPQEMGQTLRLTILFSVYEPGNRLPGFVDSMKNGRPDMTLLQDGTEAGLFTLFNWTDDAMELVLRERAIPGTDMILEDASAVYSLYTDQSYIVDKRPLYYGFMNLEYRCFASHGNDHGRPSKADRLLDGLD